MDGNLCSACSAWVQIPASVEMHHGTALSRDEGTSGSSPCIALTLHHAWSPAIPQSRRATLATIAAGAAALTGAAPAFAAYGDSANVFGKVTNTSGFLSYVGDGFTVQVPSKWNPSREREFKDMVLRYEDNFDTVNYFGGE